MEGVIPSKRLLGSVWFVFEGLALGFDSLNIHAASTIVNGLQT